MKSTTCFACHHVTDQSAGPSYAAIAARYRVEPEAGAKLQSKIIQGGVGVWGPLPMPPHPQHTPAEAARMVDWILSLAQRRIATLPPAAEGRAPVPEAKSGFGRVDNTVMVLTASTTDQGAAGLPPLRGAAEVVLRSRRQRAACFDRSQNAAAQDNLDQGGLVARLQPGGWIAFDRIRLQDFGHLKLSGWPQGSQPLTVSILAGGRELGRQVLPPGPAASRQPPVFHFPMPPAMADGVPQQIRVKLEGAPGSLLELMWVEFLPHGAKAP